MRLVKKFLFASICMKIILRENFLHENLLGEKKRITVALVGSLPHIRLVCHSPDIS